MPRAGSAPESSAPPTAPARRAPGRQPGSALGLDPRLAVRRRTGPAGGAEPRARREPVLRNEPELEVGPPTQPIGRVTGENPSYEDRLEGLASRATTPGGGVRAVPGDALLGPDPMLDEPLPPPTAPAPVLASSSGQGRPDYAPFDEPYDDGFAGDVYGDSYDEPYDDYDDEPAEPSRRPGCAQPVVVLAVVAVVLVVALLAVGFWVRGKIDPAGEPGEEVRIEIVAGQSTSEIGQTLEDADIISSATVWSWYVRFKGGGDIQAGVYEIPTNLSMGEALDALGEKPLPPGTKRVTIPEGVTIAQIAQRVTESDGKVEGFTPDGFTTALQDPAVRSKYLPAGQASLEGTLFPDTYDLPEDGTEKLLLQKMRDQFDATLDELNVTAEAQKIRRSPYDVIIVASIVEEEARVDEDRARIARVIYNRLAAGQALFIDAINCYEKGQVPCRLDDADFEKDSKYNSRKVKGLPPTPIAAPGRASLEAALHPADGDWMYYVLDPELPEGHHLFTASEDEFQAAKARCIEANLGCG